MNKLSKQNTSGKKLRIGIVLLFALSFVIFLAVKIAAALRDNEKAMNEMLSSTYALTKEDSSIISEQYWNQLKAVVTINSKARNPITLMQLGGQYLVYLYRIELKSDTSLNTLFHFENRTVDITTGYSYGIMSHAGYFDFKYITGHKQPVSNIYMTLSGKNIQQVASLDTLIVFKALAETFSLRYAKDEPKDIVILGQDRLLGVRTSIPMAVYLVKRNASVYLVVLTPNDPKKYISNELFQNILE